MYRPNGFLYIISQQFMWMFIKSVHHHVLMFISSFHTLTIGVFWPQQINLIRKLIIHLFLKKLSRPLLFLCIYVIFYLFILYTRRSIYFFKRDSVVVLILDNLFILTLRFLKSSKISYNTWSIFWKLLVESNFQAPNCFIIDDIKKARVVS